MTCPFTQTYAADAASPTCQAFWVQSIWAPHVAHGSDRRSVFSTTVTRLPKLHELSNACAAATRSCTADGSFIGSIASICPSGGPFDAAAGGAQDLRTATGAGTLHSVGFGFGKHPHSV